MHTFLNALLNASLCTKQKLKFMAVAKPYDTLLTHVFFMNQLEYQKGS